jgi:hypothetical protein
MHCKLNFLVTLLLVCYRAGRLEEPINILVNVHKKRPLLPLSPHPCRARLVMNVSSTLALQRRLYRALLPKLPYVPH